MPVFNAEKFIGPAVRSILEQTFENLELILIDDGSTDGSAEEIAKFADARLICLKHETNQGYPAAMNTGLARARGEFVARMDGDDLSEPTRLERQAVFLQTHPDYSLVGTRYSFMTPKGFVCREHDNRNYDHDELVNPKEGFREENWESIKLGKRWFADASVMTRKEEVFEAGGYRTYQRSGQDVDLWLRLLERKEGKGATLLERLYCRRLVISMISLGGGASTKSTLVRTLAEQRKANGSDSVMRGENISELNDQTAPLKTEYWRLMGLWNAADICMKARDYGSSFRFAAKAILYGGVRRNNISRFVRFGKTGLYSFLAKQSL